jgi:anti-sigma factor RsiW
MTQKSCNEIEEMLVEYADGELSPSELSRVEAHLAGCERCRKTAEALRSSLELANALWRDGLTDAESIHISAPRSRWRFWRQYAAVAASILVLLGAYFFRRDLGSLGKHEVTLAEIERKVTQAGNAARLLAATDLLAKYPAAEALAKRQYGYIIETYPDTPAAANVQFRMQ